MAQRRFGWSRLSESYRRRLIGSGISRADWERGADLRKARGHRPKSAAPRGASEQQLQQWYRKRPEWQRGLPIDLAAPMSELRGPSRWTNVVLVPSTGDNWTLSVEYKDGTFQDVLVPRGAVGDLMDWLNDQESDGQPLDWDVGTSP